MMTHTDAGWAWAVLGGSTAGLFLSGLQRYFVGVMHAELLREYRASNTTTAWVGALYVSLMDLGGPLASAVIGRYGCRVCCIVGGVLCFLGFGASAFTTSITQLFFTYGVVAGLGLGLTYSPHVLSVGYYFNRLLPMASGLSSGAAALGMLCGPVLIQTLVNEYRVSGGFLLLAAISLHHCVSGMLFRPNAPQGSKRTETSFQVPGPSKDRNEYDGSGSLPFLGISLEDVTQPETVAENGTGDDTKEGLTEEDSGMIQRKDLKQVVLYTTTETELESYCSHQYDSQDVLHNKPEDPETETCCLNQHTNPEALDTELQTNETGISCLYQCEPQEVLTQEYKTETSRPNQHTTFVNQDNVTRTKIPNSELSEDDADTSLNSQEFLKLPEKQRELVTDSEPKLPRDQQQSRHSESGVSRSSKDGSSSDVWSRLRDATENYREVLSNTAFMLHCVSRLLSYVHQAGVFLHLPEYVQTLGTSPTLAAQLFIAAGSGSLVSRVGSGLMTTDTAIDPLVVSLGMSGLAGLATVLLPLYSATYPGQIVFCLLMGLYTGGLAALLNVLTKRFVGLACLHTAFGFCIFFSGIGAILGPLLAALVIDYGGKYEHSYVILGSVMLMASFLDLVAGVIFLRQNDSADVDKTEEI